jgi:hypothetical protein
MEVADTIKIGNFEKIPPEEIYSTLSEIPEYEIDNRVRACTQEKSFAGSLIDHLKNLGVYPLETLIYRPLNHAEWIDTMEVVNQHSKTTWKTVDLTRCKSYVAQEKDFCARATLQMVNYFYTFYKGGQEESQYAIDRKLNNWGYEKHWQQAFFKYLTQETGLSQPVLDFASPDKKWLRMRSEIDANRPFVALWDTNRIPNHPGHMNFAMGYKEVEPYGGVGPPMRNKYLGIYDTDGRVDWDKIYWGSKSVYTTNGPIAKFITARP